MVQPVRALGGAASPAPALKTSTRLRLEFVLGEKLLFASGEFESLFTRDAHDLDIRPVPCSGTRVVHRLPTGELRKLLRTHCDDQLIGAFGGMRLTVQEALAVGTSPPLLASMKVCC